MVQKDRLELFLTNLFATKNLISFLFNEEQYFKLNGY